MYTFSHPVRASLIVLFDTAESRHLCMQVVSLAVNMSEKPKSGAVI